MKESPTVLQKFSLAGKTALVTGASSGIGAHLAKTLSAAGARVVIGARRTDRLDQLAADIRSNGGEVLAVAMDVTSRESVELAFDAAEEVFGVVDVVVNNAGIAHHEAALKLSEEHWREMLSTNLDGVWRVAQCGAQRMAKAKRPGSIINIASIMGLGVKHQVSHYCTAKAGVIQLTKSLALELAHRQIRVNAIAPGFYQTEITDGFLDSDMGTSYMQEFVPMRRAGQLEDLEGATLLLSGDAAAYITGTVLPVDGGHLVRTL
ncbi:3-oxoacyl-[acyl-carrier-protein] reductase FabG [compost metagenome]